MSSFSMPASLSLTAVCTYDPRAVLGPNQLCLPDGLFPDSSCRMQALVPSSLALASAGFCIRAVSQPADMQSREPSLWLRACLFLRHTPQPPSTPAVWQNLSQLMLGSWKMLRLLKAVARPRQEPHPMLGHLAVGSRCLSQREERYTAGSNADSYPAKLKFIVTGTGMVSWCFS